jgi:hypothetical protein
LKRGIMGSFHHVSKEYVPLYLAEFSFRHPKFAGLLTFVALAVTFSPRASVTTWICLLLAWILGQQ